MFKHEAAPLCKELDKCRLKKCHFSHFVDDAIEEHSVDNDGENENEAMNDNDEYCGYCHEVMDHSQNAFQECSKCDFKCGEEYNKHWRDTPDHIFSTEELRDMGRNV